MPDTAINCIAASQPLRLKLLSRGISAEGIRQLLAGEIITGLADRRRITQMIHAEKNQDIEVENDETHQMNRTETVDKNETISIALKKTGISTSGVQQCLNSQIISNADDRAKLALVFPAIFNNGI